MKHKINVLISTVIGNALIAFAVCAFVIPNEFMLGGSTGISLSLQALLPLRLSVWSAIINGSLFFLGWAFLGKEFAATSLLSTVIYPAIMAVFELLPLGTLFPEDRLTCAIFCAILSGLGIGIVIRAGGSTGGMDIPSCILQKYKDIPVGTSLMFFDIAVVALQVCIHGLSGVLHSIIIILIMSLTINRAVVTGEQKVQIIIFSPLYDQIRQVLLDSMDTGVTMLNIETGYESNQQKAVYSVVYAKKYPAIRDAVLKLDPKAFIVTADVTNVNGQGYTISRIYNQSL